MPKTIVIAGSGFGGLEAALRLRDFLPAAKITVIDKSRFFTYQPALPVLARKKVNRKKMTIELGKIYAKKKIKFYQEEVIQIKPLEKAIVTVNRKINFDYLIIALGGAANYYDIEGLEENSQTLKSFSDGEKIRTSILRELEKARYYTRPPNIVICGTGLTGVELAAEVADKVRNKIKVILVGSSNRLMGGFKDAAAEYAGQILSNKGIEVRNGCKIIKAENGRIILDDGSRIEGGMIIWCGGIKPNPITEKTGLRLSDKGGIMINEFLETDHPMIYAIGDSSYDYRNPQPTTAQTAMKQGMLAAENILADINRNEKKVFMQNDYPYLVSLGKGRAMLVKETKFKKGTSPLLMKKLVEKEYLFKHRHWIWPVKSIGLK